MSENNSIHGSNQNSSPARSEDGDILPEHQDAIDQQMAQVLANNDANNAGIQQVVQQVLNQGEDVIIQVNVTTLH
jgi:hypothetical protein